MRHADTVAHIIREPSKSLAKSTRTLQADKRWAVTATPIHNRLTDLFSLFKFLGCSPFNDQKVFNAQVAQNWRARSDPDSVVRLKTLVNCLALRRPKTTIELPPRKDKKVELDFSIEEWEDYHRVKTQTRYKLDGVGVEGESTKFLNALKWVNELRLICIHGVRNIKAPQPTEHSPPAWAVQEAQARFDQLDEVGLAKCSNFACCEDLTSALASETGAEHEDDPWISESLEIWCSVCFKGRGKTGSNVVKICNHLPRRSKKQDAIDEECEPYYEGDSSSRLSLITPMKDERLPTKVRRLLRDLSEAPEGTKRLAINFVPPSL